MRSKLQDEIVFWAPKPLKIQILGVTQPQASHSPYILGDTTRPRHITYVLASLIEIGSKIAEKNSAQTNRQTDTTKIMVTWPWINTRYTPETFQRKLKQVFT